MLKKKLLQTSSILFTIYVLAVLICFPAQMLSASLNGVRLWLNIVLPSLLPFMVGVSILNSLGASRILGTILEPIVKPIFHVSGYGAFPFVMGIFSGYPMGAKITQQLLDEHKITPIEAQRILSFSNNPGVLFILGTVASGMFSCPSVGYFLLFVAILSAVSTGFCFRFYHPGFQPLPVSKKNRMQLAAEKKIGVLLGESVKNAMETITQIGGFIILFSVIIQALYLTGVVNQLSLFLNSFLPIEKDAVYGMISGILEMTNGANVLSKTALSFSDKIIYTACILSLGGFSILAQTLSILHCKELKVSVYCLSKLMNGVFAFLYAKLLSPFFLPAIEKAVPVFKLNYGTAIHHFTSAIFVLLCLSLFLFWTKAYQSRKRN